MWKLLVYIKEYKKETILAPLFKLLEAVFELLVPVVIANMIDIGIAEGNTGYIGVQFGYLLVLALIGLGCSVTAQFFAAKAAVGFATGLRSRLFAHIQKFSFTQIDEAGTSTLITRMTSDINQVQSGVNLVLRLFLRSPIIILGAMIMACTINRREAWIFVIAIPLLALVVFGIMLLSIPLYKKVQANLDKLFAITRENLTGVRVIRAFHKEEAEIKRFAGQNQILSEMQIFTGKITAIMNPVTYVIVNGAVIALIYGGALQVQRGSMTQGEVIALINYMSQILIELIKLADLIITVTKAVACGDRIQAVFAIEGTDISEENSQNARKTEEAEEIQKIKEDNPDRNSILKFAHVSLRYQGAGAEALTDLNFEVKRGETVGIIGGTGSGKTSLVHLIPGFYYATKGTVYLEGQNVAKLPTEILRSRIGIVMQNAVLFQGTVRSNLCWGKADATEEEMWEALTRAQAREVVENKKLGLDAQVSQGGKNFSGGQKQRLTIARALIRKPDILILDDSASALDFATDARLRKAIRESQQDTTVFIVSQRAASIQYADKIIVLEDGEIAGMGTHQELLETSDVYQEIYYSQFPEEA